jgi:hypothetical protein
MPWSLAAGDRRTETAKWSVARVDLSRRTIYLLRRTITGMVGPKSNCEGSEFMSKNNKTVWKTKYGARRVRVDAPTLAEAISAAQDLSGELDAQVEIAASLIGLPSDQVRAELLKVTAMRKGAIRSVVFSGPASAPRAIAVERKPSRRVISAASRAGRPALNGPRGMSSGSIR